MYITTQYAQAQVACTQIHAVKLTHKLQPTHIFLTYAKCSYL